MDKCIIAIQIEREQEIYCPMCEVWHENNSFCQAGDGGYEIQ